MTLGRLAAALGLMLVSGAVRAELGINVFGLSYHVERDRARQIGVDNGVNPGIGLRWRDSARGGWFADAGAYHDSGRNTALFAGAGYLWPLGERWRFGGALTAFHSDTYNRGKGFVTPVPVLAYETPRFTVNLTFFPKAGHFNEINTFGLWVTFW